MSTQTRIIRLPQVVSITGLSKSSIYNFIAEGSFPKPIPLGSRSKGFIESEVTAWIESRIQARDEVTA
ncbi:helix-turn-helix transcriptional regulator [Vibrio rumoiensis]|uniref:helix-turn-helix transcriptional regulator n=1 Tax=Vibrio rumoiensis TaxID=76258 RepID=UPI003AA7F6C6